MTAQKRIKFKICALCQIKFRKEDGTSRYQFCSVGCKNKSMIRYTPDELLKTIKATAKKIKRVPAKRELKELVECCARTFGSWNNAVIAAGLIPNRSHSQRMYRRMNTMAKDGHACDSVSEAIVDNWLTDHRIEHTRDASYPSTHHKADWNIRGTFVEYFGLAKDSPRYDRAIETKRDLCRKHNIPLVEIYPEDIYPDVFLEPKLNNVLAQL